jgi:hypothetical protein
MNLKRIFVTKKDIQYGFRQSECCPVALALVRGFKLSVDQNALVRPEGLYVESIGWFKLPPSVRVFMKAFDEGTLVKPFSFTLDIEKALHARKFYAKRSPTKADSSSHLKDR